MATFLFFFFPFALVSVINLSLSFGVTKESQSIMISSSLLQEDPASSSKISELEREAS